MQRISVSDFGPIHRAEVDLRPLTVLAGPSSAGKSYLLTMIHSISSLGRKLAESTSDALVLSGEGAGGASSDFADVEKIVRWMKEGIESIDESNGDLFMEIPGEISEIFGKTANDSEIFSNLLNAEMPQFLDPEPYFPEPKGDAPCFSISGSPIPNQELLYAKYMAKGKEYKAKITQRKILKLGRSGHSAAKGLVREAETCLGILKMGIPEELRGTEQKSALIRLRAIFRSIVGIYYSDIFGGDLRETKFLSASRATMMMHKHVYFRAGVRNFEVTEHIQRITMDPISVTYLSDMDLPGGDSRQHEETRILSEKIEREMLEGQIIVKESSTRDISYWFKPEGVEGILHLSRSSSMAAQLAPLVVYIRELARVGDTIIIEEPESHLHPRMQEKVMDCIALIVKSGIRVIMSTHSEWIAERLSYLVHLSDLNEDHRRKFPGHNCSLGEGDVGVWEFGSGGKNIGSTAEQIEFRKGAYDLDYSKFGTETFNLHCKLDEKIRKIKNKNTQEHSVAC